MVIKAYILGSVVGVRVDATILQAFDISKKSTIINQPPSKEECCSCCCTTTRLLDIISMTGSPQATNSPYTAHIDSAPSFSDEASSDPGILQKVDELDMELKNRANANQTSYYMQRSTSISYTEKVMVHKHTRRFSIGLYSSLRFGEILKARTHTEE